MEYMSLSKKPKVYYGYIVAFSTFLIILLTFGTVYSFGVFLEPMIVDLGLTVAMTSGAYSLGIFVRGLLGIATGRLSDRFGPRIVLTVSGIFLGLGYLLMSQIKASWELYLYYGVIVAIGQGGTFVPAISTIARWFVKRRGMMTGIVVAGSSIGIIIMAPAIEWLIASYGWRTAYITIGAIVLVLIILVAQFVKRDPSQMGLLPYGADELKAERGLNLNPTELSLREAVRTRQLWMLSIIFFFYMFCFQTAIVHIVYHTIGLGISAAGAANLLATIAAMSVIGKIAVGSIADRIGSKSALTLSFALLAASFLWLIPAKELWMLYLFAVVFGFGWGGGMLVAPLSSELFGQGSLGAIVGTIVFTTDLGGTFGPVTAGRIFDVVGNYQPAFLICAALSIISIIITLLLRPLRKQTLADTSG